MTTLATAANMRAFQLAHPTRQISTSAGEVTVLGVRCFAVSVNNPEERCSADPGDYFLLSDDEPLRDSDGEPMVLALERSYLVDALTGEPL